MKITGHLLTAQKVNKADERKEVNHQDLIFAELFTQSESARIYSFHILFILLESGKPQAPRVIQNFLSRSSIVKL